MADSLTKPVTPISVTIPSVSTFPGVSGMVDPTNAENAAASVINYAGYAAGAFATSAGQIVDQVASSTSEIFVVPDTEDLEDIDVDQIVGSIGEVESFISQQEGDIKQQFSTLMSELDADITAFQSKIEDPQNKVDKLIDDLGEIIDQLSQEDTSDIDAAYAAAQLAIDSAIAAYDDSASKFSTVMARYDAADATFDQVQSAYTAVVSAYEIAAARFDTIVTAYQTAISGYDGVIATIDATSAKFNALDSDYTAVSGRFDQASDEAHAAAESIRTSVTDMKNLIESLTGALDTSGITTSLANIESVANGIRSDFITDAQLITDLTWDVARNKLQREADRETQIAYERAAARGFSMPSIVSDGAVERASITYADKLAELAKETSIDNAKRLRDLLIQGADIQTRTIVASANARIEAEKFIVDAKLRGIDSMIRSNEALVQAVQIRIDAAKASIEGVNAKRQGIEAQMQAAEAKLRAVDAKVAGVDASLKGAQTGLSAVDGRLKGADAKLRGAEAKLQSANAQLESAKASLSIGDARLKGGDAKIKIGDAKAHLKEVILNIRNALVNATSGAINGMSNYIQSQVTVLQGKTQPRTQFFNSYSQLGSTLSNLFTARFQAASVVVNAKVQRNNTHNSNAVAVAEATNRAGEAIAKILGDLGQEYCSIASSSISSLNAVSNFSSQEITSG